MRKQTLAFFLCLVLVLSLLSPVAAMAWEEIPTSGSIGNNVTWNLDRDAGILSFEGTGRIYDASDLSHYYYWWRDGDLIREIRFSSGITQIGYGLFSFTEYSSYSDLQRLRNVRSVRIPESIARIGLDAFRSCSRLDEITVLNPDCMIEYSPYTLGVPGRTVVAGYPDSTAERYAREFDYEFRAIGCEDGAHVFSDTVITPAGCTQDGVMESECVICGYKTRRPVPAGHDYAVTERLARTTYTCTRCGDSYVAGECVPLKADEPMEFTVEEGAYFCVSFTPEQTDRYYFGVDQFGAWEAYGYQDVPTTIYNSAGMPVETEYYLTAILEAGETYYYRSNQVYDEALPARAYVETVHELVQVETEATCTEWGRGTYVCAYCGETEWRDDEPLGHDYEETVVTEPDCTRKGLAEYTCTRCGDRYTEELPESHWYNYDVDLPWYQHGTCELCGKEYVRGTPEPPILELDKPVRVTFDEDGMCYFFFTPKMAERYVFVSDLDWGVEGAVYDTDGSWPGYHWQDAPFSISSTMYAGQTYCIILSRFVEDLESFQGTLEVQHDYMSEVTTEPTCTSEGVLTSTCRFCGNVVTEVLPESHEWMYDVDLPWYQHAVCELCGKEQDFGTRTPPALTLGEEYQPAFDEDFEAYYSFTPEVTDYYTLAFTDLNYYDAGIQAFAPNGEWIGWGGNRVELFMEAGETYYFRLRSYNDQSDTPPVVLQQTHDYMYMVAKPATCTEDGLRVVVCALCGETHSEAIPAAHSYYFDVYLPWYQLGICQYCGELYENGDPLPPEIEPDMATDVHIHEIEGIEYFRFTPEKTGRYSFSTSSDEMNYCVVYSADGNYISDFVSENEFDFYQSDCVLHAGWTYYLGIGFEDYEQTGDFSVTFRLLNEVQELSLTLDEKTNVKTDSQNLISFFSFTPEVDGYYEFFSDSIRGGSVSVALYNEAGDVMDWSTYYADPNFRIRCSLSAGQTYHLMTRYYWNGEFYGAFNVSVREVIPPDPTPLTLGERETARITEDHFSYFFCFTPERSGSYSFSANSGSDTCCWLYDSAQNIIGYSDDTQFSADFRLDAYLLAGQTYYYEVSFFGGGKGSIPVILELRNTITEIHPGESEIASITEPGGTAYFTFTPDQTDIYAFFSSSEMDSFCQLFDNADNIIAGDDDSGENDNFRLELPLVGGQTYQFAVRMYQSHMTGTIPVTLLQVHAYEPSSQIAPTCTEPGGTAYDCTYCGDRYVEPSEPALGHDWGEITYTWSEDKSTVTASRTCKRDPSHVETETVATTASVIKEATADAEGEQTVTADFENAAFADQSDRVSIPKLVPAFTDMPDKDNWAYDAIEWAVANGVTNGTTNTTFSPDSTCTRAQIVTFLWRAEGQPEPGPGDNPFEDVAEGQYYYKAVLWAVEKGVTNGVDEKHFAPNAGCTRGQVVTFLWRCAGKPAPETAENRFEDVDKDQYYYDAVLWAAENDITNGTAADKFSPDSTCTRAQIVTFLYRAKGKTS